MGQISLVDFIDHLSRFNQQLIMPWGYHSPHATIGDEIAFEIVKKPTTISDMLTMAKDLIGEEFQFQETRDEASYFFVRMLTPLRVGDRVKGESREMVLQDIIDMFPAKKKNSVSVDLKGNVLPPSFEEIPTIFFKKLTKEEEEAIINPVIIKTPFEVASFSTHLRAHPDSIPVHEAIESYMNMIGKQITEYINGVINGNGR